MNEKYVKIYEYELNRDIIKKCTDEKRELTDESIKTEVHKMLEENKISYKNKIVEHWEGLRIRRYIVVVEVYVLKADEIMAKQVLSIPNELSNDTDTELDEVVENTNKKQKRVMLTLITICCIIPILLIFIAYLIKR